MDYKRFFLIAVTAIITTSLQSVVVLSGILPAQQVLAQTTEPRKAEADRLLLQGMQQVQANLLEPALKSLQEVLIMRQAMLTTMKQRPNPRDWAAFTLIGEAE